MSRSLAVVDGALLRCNVGSLPAALTTTDQRFVTAGDSRIATLDDGR